MKYSQAIAIVLSASVVTAVPKTYYYDPKIPTTIFTDATCKLSKSLTPGQPLSNFYAPADHLGKIVTPFLDAVLGKQTVEDLDRVADQLCVDAQQEPNAGNGICQDTLQAIKDFVQAKVPATQAKKYECLLNLICLANVGPKYQGTCDYLLSGLDCVANRIVGVKVKECTGKM